MEWTSVILGDNKTSYTRLRKNEWAGGWQPGRQAGSRETVHEDTGVTNKRIDKVEVGFKSSVGVEKGEFKKQFARVGK